MSTLQKKRIYLSKSKVALTHDVVEVRRQLVALQDKGWQFEIKEFDGGVYGAADDKVIRDSDILIVVPPKDQRLQAAHGVFNVGKGIHSSMDTFYHEIGHYKSDIYIAYGSAIFRRVTNYAIHDPKDYITAYCAVTTHNSRFTLENILNDSKVPFKEQEVDFDFGTALKKQVDDITIIDEEWARRSNAALLEGQAAHDKKYEQLYKNLANVDFTEGYAKQADSLKALGLRNKAKADALTNLCAEIMLPETVVPMLALSL